MTAVRDAYQQLVDAASLEAESWAQASPNNAKLKRIAIRLSGLSNVSAHLLVQLDNTRFGPTNVEHVIVGYDRMQPAWTMWIEAARNAIAAVELEQPD